MGYVENLSDQQIIQRILAGQKDCFEILVKRYEKVIWAYLLPKMNYHQQDVEDVCSEVWAKVYQNLEQYKADFKFFSWLYQIARHTCIDYARRKSSHDLSLEPRKFLPDLRVSTESDHALGKKLTEILARLRPEDRNILLRRYVQGLSIEEIGRLEKMPQQRVSVRLVRAKQRAKKLIANL